LKKLFLAIGLVLLLISIAQAGVTGFRDAKFGMSEEKVSEILNTKEEVGGKEYYVETIFHEDQLFVVLLMTEVPYFDMLERRVKVFERIFDQKFEERLEDKDLNKVQREPAVFRVWAGDESYVYIGLGNEGNKYQIGVGLVHIEISQEALEAKHENMKDAF